MRNEMNPETFDKTTPNALDEDPSTFVSSFNELKIDCIIYLLLDLTWKTGAFSHPRLQQATKSGHCEYHINR